MIETAAIALADHALPPGWGPWNLPAGWRYLPDGGPDGAPALGLTRVNAAEYLNARLPFPLAPESRCRLSSLLYLEEGSDAGASANAGIEFFDAEGRFLGGGYLPPVKTAGAWVNGETEFTVPQYTAECRLMFYLGAGKAGAARFAAPVLSPAAFRWTTYLLTPVRDELPAGGGAITFGCFILGQPEPAPEGGWRCRVEVHAAGQTVTAEAPVQDGRFSVHLDPLPAGPATLRVQLRDAGGRAFGERDLRVTLVDEPAAACTLDARGRLQIDGQPFMPIALYMGEVQRNELDEIAASPFNCVLPYSSPALKFAGSPLAGVDAVREVFDACHAHGLRVIFSLSNTYDDWHYPFTEALGAHGGLGVMTAAVQAFAGHPSLIAWYLNDEQPIERIPMLQERRRLIRGMDPNHPIYAVMCQVPELPFYTELCDVYGIDPYPIVDPACNHIRSSRYTHDMAEQAAATADGIALWTVVQAHNVGNYDPQANADPEFARANYRDPSFDEMLALALLAAIRGAKGFLFYSYFDLPNPAFEPGGRARRWDNLCRVGQALREVEPFLMADAGDQQFTLRVLEGQVEARAFRNPAGQECLLLVAIGPGPCRAEVEMSGGKAYISQFGRTAVQGNGYLFTGTDACADVLIS